MALNCKICNTEIPYGSYCTECVKCKYCTHDVGEDLIEKQLRGHEVPGDCSDGEILKVYHPYCHNKKLEEDFKNKPVTITQDHLDMLNSANLMFRANLDLSIETNQKDAEIQAHKFVHKMTLEEKFITLKRLEAVAAMWSIALSKDKNRIKIQLAEKERIKFKELQQEDDKLEYEKKREKKNVKAALAGNLTPEEKQREKAIMQLCKLPGIDREKAIEMLQKKN